MLSAGEKNHRYFVGFLVSLLMMCCWMIWGCVRYFQAACDGGGAGGPATEPPGLGGATLLRWGACSAWVAWVCANALFHLFWVSVLTGCQLYLVVCLGMTTNEQLNRSRYRHFQARGGRSPFSRGPLNNAADFFQCGLCGLLQPRRRDWADADADADLDADADADADADRRPMLADQFV